MSTKNGRKNETKKTKQKRLADHENLPDVSGKRKVKLVQEQNIRVSLTHLKTKNTEQVISTSHVIEFVFIYGIIVTEKSNKCNGFRVMKYHKASLSRFSDYLRLVVSVSLCESG